MRSEGDLDQDVPGGDDVLALHIDGVSMVPLGPRGASSVNL